MSTAHLKAQAKSPEAQMDALVFCILLVFTLTAYRGLAAHNLPVAANIDDRTSLMVLQRFNSGSANPKFFMYPTLYYYLTYFLVIPFGFSRVLLTGHLLNLGFLALTGFLSYVFCKKHFRSATAGIVAACCVVTSPTLLASGSYLCTDVLLSGVTILSLDLLLRYTQSRSRTHWFQAIFAIAVAVATKYTAVILFFVYLCVEVQALLGKQSSLQAAEQPEADSNFERNSVSAVFIGCGLAVLFAAVCFPTAHILQFVAAHRTNLETRSAEDYRLFLRHVRNDMFTLAILLSACGIAVRVSSAIYKYLSLKKLTYSVLVLLAVFVMSTPFSLLDATKFVYDLGALLRSNVVVQGSHQQWGNYVRWLFKNENAILVLSSAVGLGIMLYQSLSKYFAAFLFLAFYTCVIGSSHLGTERYLDPILPLLYCGTGFCAVQAWTAFQGRNAVLLRTTMGVLAALSCVQMAKRLVQKTREATQSDAFYSSYELVRQLQPSGTVYYAGYAPSAELETAGLRLVAIGWPQLAKVPLAESLTCEDLLIVNERQGISNHVWPQNDPTVTVLLNDPRGAGQMVLRRSGCPAMAAEAPPGQTIRI